VFNEKNRDTAMRPTRKSFCGPLLILITVSIFEPESVAQNDFLIKKAIHF